MAGIENMNEPQSGASGGAGENSNRPQGPEGLGTQNLADAAKAEKQALSQAAEAIGEIKPQFPSAASESSQSVPTVQPPLKYTTEQLRKIPAETRLSFLKALPPDQQVEAMRVLGLEIRGGAVDWISELNEALQQKSQFQETLELYETLERANKNRSKIPHNRLTDFDNLLKDTEKRMEDLTQDALASPILAHKGFVREKMLEVYTEAMQDLRILQTPPKVDIESWSGPPPTPKSKDEILAEVHQVLGQEPNSSDPQTGELRLGEFHFKEDFWQYGAEVLADKFGISPSIEQSVIGKFRDAFAAGLAKQNLSPDVLQATINTRMTDPKVQQAMLKQITDQKVAEVQKLKQTYEGVASYLVSKVDIAIKKDFNGLPLKPGTKDQEAGDKLLGEIKVDYDKEFKRRQLERREKRKRASRYERLPYNSWREKFEFYWAETPEELRETVYIWLDWFQKQLRDDTEEKIYEAIGIALQQARSSLERMFPRLGMEPDSPLANELRTTIDAYVTVLGGVKLLEKGSDGFEAYTKFLTDFCKKFTPNHDTIYLGNVKSAIIQDFLSDGKISLGGPDDIVKPDEGETKDHRGELELAAKRYAETHELFLKVEDFEEAKDTRYGWNDKIEKLLLVDKKHQDKVAAMPDSPEKTAALDRIETRTKLFQAIKERLEKEDITREERKRGEKRTLGELTSEERQQRIRQRIRAEMDKRAEKGLGEKIDKAIQERVTAKFRDAFAAGLAKQNLSPDVLQATINTRMTDPKVQQALQQQIINAKDQAYWGWLEKYNVNQEANSKEKWFPSFWDRVRLSIDRPTKLIDRALTKEQFKAMIEGVNDPDLNLTEEEIRLRVWGKFNKDIAQDEYLKELSAKELKEEFENRVQIVLFQKEQRRAEAESAFNINRAYQKFLGVDARWGGLTTRYIDKEGKVAMKTLYAEEDEIIEAKLATARAQLKEKVRLWREGYVACHPGLSQAAIDAEAVKVKEQYQKDYPDEPDTAINRMMDIWRRGFEAVATSEGLTKEQIDKKVIAQTRLFRRQSVFAVRLAFEDVGLKGKADLGMYSDPQWIKEATMLLGYTDDNKEQLLEVLERERREEEAVQHYVLQKYMETTFGGFLAVRDDPDLIIEDKEGNLRKYHEEQEARARVINEGGDFTQRNIFESAAMISTSGGVKVPDLITRLAELGVRDFLRELGCDSFLDLQGRLKRRDEAELRRQSFFHSRYWTGPVSWVKRLRGANAARTFLVGGEVQGQGYVLGVLNEPYNGLWRLRDELLHFEQWITKSLQQVMSGTKELPRLETDEDWVKFLSTAQLKTQETSLLSPEDLEKYQARVLKLLEYKDLGKYLQIVHKDKMTPVEGEIIKFLTGYMDSRKYLMNRAGFADKRWQYDNELMLRAFFGLTSKTEPVTVKKGDLRRVDIDEKTGKEIPIYYEEDGDYRKYLELPQTGGEKVGSEHLAYAPEGRTPVANNFFMTVLRGSSYHILDKADARTLDGLAWRTKIAMDAKRAEIVSQPLPPEVIAKRDKWAATLKKQHVKKETIEKEKEKIETEYVEDRLHTEFVGEWPARLLAD